MCKESEIKAEEILSQIKEEEEELLKPSTTDIIWKNVVVLSILHIFSIIGLIRTLTFQIRILTFIWMFVVGIASGFGITIGAHRLFSHKSFKASRNLKLFLVFLQTLAGQFSVHYWVTIHRLHHKYSDTNADPHNVNRGFWYSHVGWVAMEDHPMYIEKEKKIDLSDIESDSIVMFQKRWYKQLYVLIVIFLPTIIPVLLWNEIWTNSLLTAYFVRYTVVLHGVACVNSIAHKWGPKPYDNTIRSSESPFVSFYSLGEGWHNYHHAFPWDYRAAESGLHYSPSTKLIDWFASNKWAYDLKTASDDLVKKRILRSGDIEHLKNISKYHMEEAEPHPDDITDLHAKAG